MWKLPLLSIGLMLSLLFVAARIWLTYIALFGFPDGAAPELDRAENGLAFFDGSLLVALWLLGLAALGFVVGPSLEGDERIGQPALQHA